MTGRWTKRNCARALAKHCCGCCNDPRWGVPAALRTGFCTYLTGLRHVGTEIGKWRAETGARKPRAYAVMVQSQHLPQLPHGQLSSGRHQALVDDRGGLMSESLTRRKNAANRRKAAGFISESRPASRRNTRPE